MGLVFGLREQYLSAVEKRFTKRIDENTGHP